MPTDPRDELWEASFDTYYVVHYEELLADRLIDSWQKVDEITKVLVALTASGSAVSGWALWAEPHFRRIWVIMASIAAVLSIVHTALSVPGRLKDHGETKRRFASLRTDLETFRYRMRIDANFPIEEFTQEFVEYRRRFSDSVQLRKNDILRTNRLENKVQKQLDIRLEDQVMR